MNDLVKFCARFCTQNDLSEDVAVQMYSDTVNITRWGFYSYKDELADCVLVREYYNKYKVPHKDS